MSPLAALRRVRTWHPSQLVARAVVLAGPSAALLAAAAAGGAPATWAVVLVAVASLAWAARPESGAGALALVLVLLWWTRVPEDALHPAVLGAAIAVVAAHVAAVVAAAAPPRTPVDPRVARLWLVRAVVVLLPAPALWVLARALRGEDAPGGLWPAALLAALLVVTALGAVLRREPTPGAR